MSASRTVAVVTVDYGTVRIEEPVWCLGRHPAGGYRADIEHHGAEVPLILDTICHGPRQLLTACLIQRPYSEYGTTAPVVTLDFDGDHEFDSAALRDVVDALVIFALGHLTPLARQLKTIEDGAES
ncbi:DUF6907 domain-containing protein [Streptomyces sp. SGAir0957]